MTEKYLTIAIVLGVFTLFFVGGRAATFLWTIVLGLLGLGLASGYGVLPAWQG